MVCLCSANPNNLTPELAYSLLRTLRTSTISSVVDRLSPLLHMDPVIKLPPEITAEIFFYLDPASLLTSSLASRIWRSRILDSRLWRQLYIREGWGFDVVAVRAFEQGAQQEWSRRKRSSVGHSQLKKRAPPGWSTSRRVSRVESMTSVDTERPVGGMDSGAMELEHQAAVEDDHEMADFSCDDYPMRSPSTPYRPSLTPESPHVRQTRKLSLASPSPGPGVFQWDRSIEQRNWIKPTLLTKSHDGVPKLNWAYLYKQRQRLEDNWRRGRFTTFQLPHPLYPEEGHRECVYAIQFSGKWLVSGSRDRTLRVWNLETGRLRGLPLLGHTKSVLCLQFDPSDEEDIIMSGSSDQNVLIWRFSTGQKIQLIVAHHDSVLNLRFDRRFLVTCSKDKLIKVWCREELRPTDRDYPKVYKGVGVRYPSYIVDTSCIPSAILESQIANRQVRTLQPYSLLMTLDGHGAAVNAVQIGEDEIVSASGDRNIKVWGIHDGRCQKTLIGHTKGIACVQLAHRRIVSGSNDDTVRIYDHDGAAEVACLQGHQDLVRTVQAGFGDLPGADETMKLEAMAVDHEYYDARDRGDVDVESPGERRRSRIYNTGSKKPDDISAIGAKIPPGGGGGKWARIVSGSYDETIIIWRRNHEGKWVPAHRLRQEDAANAAAANLNSRHAGSSSRSLDQEQVGPGTELPGAMEAPHPNGSASAQQEDSNSNGLQNPAATAAPLGTTSSNDQSPQDQAIAAGSSQQQTQRGPGQDQGHGATQPLNIPQAAAAANGQGQPPGTQANTDPAAAGAANLALGANVHPAYRAFPHPGHPTARVFKVQFDARKLICASQDYRIVGWDFACGDEEIEEASPFFASL